MTIPTHIVDLINGPFTKMEGWTTPDKALMMIQLVLERKPALCVESGIFGGRSFCAVGLALKENGFGVVWGADPWDVESALEGKQAKEDADWWSSKVPLEQIYIGAIHWILRFELTRMCFWVRTKSEKMAMMFGVKEVDLFHQDSNHSEEVSRREVQVWAPRMKQESLWILDDTDWSTQKKAIQDITDEGFNVLHDKGTYIVFERK